MVVKLSYEILPNNICESLIPRPARIRHLVCGIKMVSLTLGARKQKVKENNIIVGEKEYAGTPGLWELIVATTPDDKIFTNADYDNYAQIMHLTNALRRNNDESETKPKANKSWKWKHILKKIGTKRICIQETV